MSQQLIAVRRSVARAIASSLVAALAIAAISGCSHASPPKQAPVATGHEALTASQLKDELISAPAASRPDTTSGLAPRSTLDLDHFVAGLFVAKAVTAEKVYLQKQGFTYAAETNWDATGGTGAEIFLIAFRSSEGARNYVGSASESAASTKSGLAGVPGERILTANSVDSYGDIVMEAQFTVNNIAVEMHYYSHATADTSGLTTLAQAQYTRLAKSNTIASPRP